MKNKVIITGGIGFIFSHVTEYLVKQGYDVVVIDNCTEGSHPEVINNSFRFFNYDAGSHEAYDLVVTENPEYIIHAAAYSDVDGSIKRPTEIIAANNAASLNMFEAARHCSNLKKFIYVSTDEVFGECVYKKAEHDTIFPKNPYACSKAFGSLLRITYDNTYPELRNKTAETRFCNVFGDRQDTRKILPNIKESLKSGKAIPLHNKGRGFREYIYVKNIPEVVELIMLKGDQTYNVTLNDGYSVEDLIKKAESVTGRKVEVVHSNRPGMDLMYQMDNERILKLGWKPKYSFEKGLREYLT